MSERVFNIMELEEGKSYKEVEFGEEYRVENGQLIGETISMGRTQITLDLDDIKTLRFVEIEKDNNPYESNDIDYFEWLDKEDELRDKLKRFSYENGGGEIVWGDIEQRKFHLKPNKYFDEISLEFTYSNRQIGQVYFTSREVAEQALEKYRDLIKEVYFQDKY